MITLLLVEDDDRLSKLIQYYLEKRDFRVAIEPRGDEAVNRILMDDPDLVILDIMLPGKSGLEVCKAVRLQYLKPIIMLTAMGGDIDQIVGLELGADDYIPKPVEPRLILARINALLRRSSSTTTTNTSINATVIPSSTFSFGDIVICKTSYEVHVNDKLIKMSNMEFELLWLLTQNAGNILSRDEILSALRGIGYDGLNRTTDITISRLRKKIGDSEQPAKIIKTIHGKGYLFSVQGQP